MKKTNVLQEEKKVAAAPVEEALAAIAPEKKTEEKKQAEKKSTAKVAEKPKKTETKETTKKASAPKKASTPKKTTATKAKKTGKKEIFVQFGNREVSMQTIIDKVCVAYKGEGHDISAEDDVRVYVKPEENMLYYVVNDQYASGINMFD